jgi:hypothetical protein
LEKLEIPRHSYGDLIPLQAEWNACYAAAIDPKDCSSRQVTSKRKACKKFEKDLRIFIKAYPACNPALVGDERNRLELPVHKKSTDTGESVIFCLFRLS